MAENLTYHEVYSKYKNLVLKVAYEHSGDYDVAEDIMQNTFLKLYMYFDDMHKGNLKSWLYTTAKHAALNYKKKAAHEVFEDDEDSEDETSVFDNLATRSAEEEIFEAEKENAFSNLHEKIFVEVLAKNPRWYEAITLVYLMEIPQKRVAEEMGIPVTVLHSLLHRAKEWIRKEYGVEYHEMNRD